MILYVYGTLYDTHLGDGAPSGKHGVCNHNEVLCCELSRQLVEVRLGLHTGQADRRSDQGMDNLGDRPTGQRADSMLSLARTC